MDSGRIRVGIIGAGGWAKYGHIPALEALEEFEVVAVSNRKMATAEGTAKQFHLKHAFGDEQSLINHPDVDLVAVVAPAPEHARLVKQAIAAGKDVYCEWPLTTSTADSEELLSLAGQGREAHRRSATSYGAERALYPRSGQARVRR